MRNASLLGIHVLATAAYSPGWASGHAESDKYPPTNVADYARFVRAVADRYGPRGTFWHLHPRLRPSPVTAIELWNEPWIGDFWRSAPDAALYARLVRAAATAVKARHPAITLLASADINDLNPTWFSSVLRADPALWRSNLVNAWSVHPYCHGDSPFVSALPAPETFDRVLLDASSRSPDRRRQASLDHGVRLANRPRWPGCRQRGHAGKVHPRRTRAGEDGMGVVHHPGLRLHLDETRTGRRLQPPQAGRLGASGMVRHPSADPELERQPTSGSGRMTSTLGSGRRASGSPSGFNANPCNEPRHASAAAFLPASRNASTRAARPRRIHARPAAAVRRGRFARMT